MKILRKTLLALLALSAVALLWAADPAQPASENSDAEAVVDIAALQAQVAEQQKQIDQLNSTLAEQSKLLDRLAKSAPQASVRPRSARVGEIASAAPMIVPEPIPARPAYNPLPAPAFSPAAPQEAAAPAGTSAPLQLRVGDTTIMPVGFMDLTASWKDKNAGGSLGSNFGSVPYNNTPQAKLSEFRFSPQNSRIGFRIDGNIKDTHFIGYNEFDFLGTSGSNAISVTNGAFVPRVRLYWVDVRKGKFEFLAGQSWTMLTPNRKGISALPGDLFYSQVIDVNYMAGLTWTRQPGVRFLYHPSSTVTMGVSFENPNQYIGGSGGGPTVTLPAALTGLAGLQVDNATSVQTVPNVHPDIIAKIAFDPNAHVHFELAGIERTFKTWNTTTGQAASGQYSTKAAGGGSINGNFEVVKNFRLVTNNFWSGGGGRYLFGNAPDLVVRADGSVSPLHSGGFVEGFEATINKFLLYAYYGAIYIGRDVAVDANGTSLVGYGYRGSSNSNNRTVQEITFGYNQTVWRDAKWGALNLMGQYMYLMRNPWYVAAGAPKATHDNTVFFNVRYTLPGGPPPVPPLK
jgi:hypothetical protein